MGQSVYLQGSEDVARAGGRISDAADIIARSASTMESALQEHKQSIVDSIQDFRVVIEEYSEKQQKDKLLNVSAQVLIGMLACPESYANSKESTIKVSIDYAKELIKQVEAQ